MFDWQLREAGRRGAYVTLTLLALAAGGCRGPGQDLPRGEAFGTQPGGGPAQDRDGLDTRRTAEPEKG